MNSHALARSVPAFRAKSRGFTLTEIAIVLGIIGIILGAIWAAAAMVYENNRTKQAREQSLAVINNWRSIYGSRHVDVADGTDITYLTVNNGFEPVDMIPSTTANGGCADPRTGSTPSAGCSIEGPWSASVVRVFTSQTDNAVQIQYSALTSSACNHYGNSIADAAGVVKMTVNGTTRTLPPLGNNTPFLVTDVSAACTTGNTNSVTVEFAMN